MGGLVDVEKLFGDYVRQSGGQVLADILPPSPTFKNADYFFPHVRVVAELKRLVENKDEDQNIQFKLQHKYDTWMREGLAPIVYGRARVESKSLPKQCQKELINVFKPPIQKRIQKANKQIKATLSQLKIENGKGLLLLVNDGNYALEADAVLYLVHRILGDAFQNINSVIYFTVNMVAKSPVTEKPTLVWVSAMRKGVPSIDGVFLQALFEGWSSFLSTHQDPIENIYVSDHNLIKHIKYVRPI